MVKEDGDKRYYWL